MNTTTYRQRRPLVVTFGLALFVANQVPDLVLDAIRGNWHSLYFYIIFVVWLAVVFVPVWFVFHGKSWARWLLATIVFVGFGAHLFSFINTHSAHSASWIALSFLKSFINFMALVALFLSSSNRWFRSCKIVLPTNEPA